jgi:V8-like Glu-specific endopeptidase
MTRTAGRARGLWRLACVLSLLAGGGAAGLALLLPATTASGRPGKTGSAVMGPVPAPSRHSRPFGGTAPVGALYTTSAGRLGHKFCTATVVQSVHGDLVVTAAHCLDRRRGQLAFVPGYVDGTEPYGSWLVAAAYTSRAWQASRDPDDDVAFLRLADSGGRAVEDVTGGELLGTTARPPEPAELIAYPVKAARPVRCVNQVRLFTATQLVFDCGGFPNGSSGAPLLAGLTAVGPGTVIGVVGGYEEGGDRSSVSYSPVFGPAVAALFQQAEASG